jgi:hypothetical protein
VHEVGAPVQPPPTRHTFSLDDFSLGAPNIVPKPLGRKSTESYPDSTEVPPSPTAPLSGTPSGTTAVYTPAPYTPPQPSTLKYTAKVIGWLCVGLCACLAALLLFGVFLLKKVVLVLLLLFKCC